MWRQLTLSTTGFGSRRTPAKNVYPWLIGSRSTWQPVAMYTRISSMKRRPTGRCTQSICCGKSAEREHHESALANGCERPTRSYQYHLGAELRDPHRPRVRRVGG